MFSAPVCWLAKRSSHDWIAVTRVDLDSIFVASIYRDCDYLAIRLYGAKIESIDFSESKSASYEVLRDP